MLIKGKFVNNNAEKLIIVFQSTIGLDLTRFDPDSLEYREYVKVSHERYVWMRTFSKYNEADYLYIQDNFNYSYGWYIKDNKINIIKNVNNYINENITKKYSEIVAFGSSKGGFAALLYGMLNKSITQIVAVVPQIRVKEYLDTIPMYNILSTCFEESDDSILFNIIPEGNKKLVIITGMYENEKVLKSTEDFLEYLDNYSNVQTKVIFDSLSYGHNRIAENNASLVLEELFEVEKNLIDCKMIVTGVDVNWTRGRYVTFEKIERIMELNLREILKRIDQNIFLVDEQMADDKKILLLKNIFENYFINEKYQLKIIEDDIMIIEFGNQVIKQKVGNWKYTPEQNGALYEVLMNGFEFFSLFIKESATSQDVYKIEGIKNLLISYIMSKNKSAYELYDQSIGSRLALLSFFYYLHKEKLNLREQKILLERLYLDLRYVNDEKYYQPVGNHGVIQVMGQLICSIVLNEKKEYLKALERLDEHFFSQFSATGLHYENSTGYQKIIYDMFVQVNNLLENDDWKVILEKVSEVIEKENHFLSRGDSIYDFEKRNKNSFTLERLQDGLILYQNERYGSSFVNGSRSYIHKHKDDLSFTFLYNNIEWFIDPGSSGYDYSTKEVVFHTTTLAHNIFSIRNEHPLWHNNELYAFLRMDKTGSSEYTGWNDSYNDANLSRRVKYYSDYMVIADIGKSLSPKWFISNFHLSEKVDITKTSNHELTLKANNEYLYLYSSEYILMPSLERNDVYYCEEYTTEYENKIIISTRRMEIKELKAKFDSVNYSLVYPKKEKPLFSYAIQKDNKGVTLRIINKTEKNYATKVFLYMNGKMQEEAIIEWDDSAYFPLDDKSNYYFVIRIFLKNQDNLEREVAFGYTRIVSLLNENGSEYEKMKEMENLKDEKIAISIFGSCVSRDAFEIVQNHQYKILEYYARASLFSIFAPKIEETYLPNSENIGLSSAFRAKQVLKEFTKEARYYMATTKSDYIIIDLLDERFGLFKFENSIISISNELLESTFYQENKIKFLPYDKNQLQIAAIIDTFYKYLENYDKTNKIILHKVFCVDYYKDREGKIRKFDDKKIIENRRINDILNQFYYYIEQDFVDLKTIQIQGMGFENHKWGLSPFHFTDDYYERFIRALDKLVQ